jgi:hypothetical protein
MVEIDDEEETTILVTTCQKNVMTEKTTPRSRLKFKVGSNRYEYE